MAEYLEVEEARQRPGLRLVLSAGVPGPWGEAAKGVFHVKGVPFARVRQAPGEANAALRAWTGHDNAPVAVYDDERPRSGWAEILLLAERLAPEPALVPASQDERAAMFGWAHELCGEHGLAWSRRLMLLHEVLIQPKLADSPVGETVRRLGAKYGYEASAAESAPARVVAILRGFAGLLEAQRVRGRRFLVGDRLTALDIFWATFAAIVAPLPEELCPMSDFMRLQYAARDPAIVEALDPALLAHRDFVYREYLELPLVF